MEQDSATGDPVRFGDGQVIHSEVDLAGGGNGIPWGHARSYGNLMSRNDRGVNGNSWLVPDLDYVTPAGSSRTLRCVVFTPKRSFWFAPAPGGGHAPMFGSHVALSIAGTGDVTFFDEESGMTRRYASLYHPVLAARGALLSITTAGGLTMTITRDSAWRITRAQTSGDVPTAYDYTYTSGNRLGSVVQSVGGSPIRRADYTYHAGTTPWGLAGDLSTATVSEWQDGAWVVLRRSAYRYYVNYTDGGFPHGLRTVLSAAGWDRMVAAGLDPLTAPLSDVEAYARSVFTYDSQRRVTSEKVRGGRGTYTMAYQASGFAPGPNSWAMRTTVTNPDGSVDTVYTNHAKQVLLRVTSAGAAPDAANSKRATTFDDQFHVLLSATPAAVASVSESTPQPFVLAADQGLVTERTWYGPGDGEKAGHPKAEYVRRGISPTNGTRTLVRERDYIVRTTATGTMTFVSSATEYPVPGSGGLTTTTNYDFFSGALQPSMVTVTRPAVPLSQNGTGAAPVTRQAFDVQGRSTWSMDPLGVIALSEYDPVTGALVRQIADVNTAIVSGAPAGWSTLPGNGRNLVTDIANDLLGRPVLQLMPLSAALVDGGERLVRRARLTERLAAVRETRVWDGYAEGEGAALVFTPLAPVSATTADAAGSQLRVITARLPETGTSYGPGPIPQDRWLKRLDNCIDRHDQLVWTRTYHRVPASGDGLNGPDFSQQDFGYDAAGRRIWSRSGGGTIQRRTFDYRGLVVQEQVGTGLSDGTSANLVATVVYAHNANGLVTSETRPVGAAHDDRLTVFSYDWRDRLVSTTAADGTLRSVSYDNLDRPVRNETYQSLGGALLYRSDAAYDNLGRTYRTTLWSVSGGVASDPVTADTWFDALGRQIKVRALGEKSWNRTQYDSLGRVVANYLGYPADGVLTGAAGSVLNDVVAEQLLQVYRDDGAIRRSTFFQRLPDSIGNGPLGWPSGTAPAARASVTGIWSDALGRQVAVAAYGTNGGEDLVLPSDIPARSDTVLVTSFTRDVAGDVVASIDPSGVVTRAELDALSRPVRKIEAWTGAAPSGGSDRTVEMAYNLDGNMTLHVLKNAVTGDQVYRWVYGTTLEDSGVASSLLLREHVTPDSPQALDPTAPPLPGNVLFAYNIQGQVVSRTDQAGTRHEYDYDDVGRLIGDNAQTLGPGVDGAIRKIRTLYDALGRVVAVTSDNQYGSVANQSAFTFDGYGRMLADIQQSGGVCTPSSPRVLYAYAAGSTGTLRRTSTTLPSGTVVGYAYGAVGSADDMLGRVTSVTLPADSATAVTYTYMGASTVISRSMPQPGLTMSMSGFPGDAGDTVGGIDRFGRVESMPWKVGSASVDVFQYGYTPSSFRRFRRNAAGPSGQDEAYGHDLLQQVTSRGKGTLNVGATGIAGIPAEEESFTYDPAGNWLRYLREESGAVEVDQARSHDPANTLIRIDGLSAKVAHDAVGNMTKFPLSYSPSAIPSTARWDAWNRLVRNIVGGDMVQIHEYDGMFRRLKTSGTLFFWSDAWQVLEERATTAPTVPKIEYIRGVLGVGELVVEVTQS